MTTWIGSAVRCRPSDQGVIELLTVERRPDRILGIRADGLLTTKDYAAFVPRFESLSKSSDRVLIELGPGFTGCTLGALWRDLKFDVEHRSRFGRIAVVGDTEWEKWATEASAPLFPGEMRFFETGAASDAETWLLEREREGRP